jgi:hypothetical protein
MNGPPGAVAWDVNGERKTAADETVELVVDRICRLDGATRTVVMIEKEDIQIGIGGGNDRRVIAYYTRDSLVFSIQSAIRTKRVRPRLVTGGRLGDSDRRNIVDIPAAASAVHELIDDGNSLHYLWERQD